MRSALTLNFNYQVHIKRRPTTMYMRDNSDFICPHMSFGDNQRSCRGGGCPNYVWGTVFEDERDEDEVDSDEDAPPFVPAHSYVNYLSYIEAVQVENMYSDEDNKKHYVDHVDINVVGRCNLGERIGKNRENINIVKMIRDPLNIGADSED